MSLPDRRQWIFALRTFAAAMAAFYLALWLDLPRPYWAMATTYITSQIFVGATRSKAVYRVGGTILGAAAAVVLVPNLVDAPVLLTLGIALWVGGCLFVSLLDRTPASYLPLLAGYTAAIIGFPSVDDPGAIFETAVSRAQEITLGILCASVAASVVAPRSVVTVLLARIDAWLAEARKRAFEALVAQDVSAEARIARLNLAADASAIDLLGAGLRYETGGPERAAEVVPLLRQHMLMVLPTSAAIVDRVRTLRRSGGMTQEIEAVLARMSDWIAQGEEEPADRVRIKAAVNAIDRPLGPDATWTDLVVASLAARLRDMVDLRADLRDLKRDLAEGRPPRGELAFRYSSRARSIRHFDPATALHSSVSAVLAIVACSAVWIATGWPSGSTAPMMTAVGCCLFASLDDPAPAILQFANWAIVGAIGAAIYLFGVLPMLTTFEQLVLVLAPPLVLCGLLMTRPSTALVGLALAANGASLLALQERYSADFASFVNSAIALVVGMGIAALTTRLVRSVSAEWIVRRLLRTNQRTLRQAARGGGLHHGLELAVLMLDRIGLAAPRIAKLPPSDAEQIGDLIEEVRVGINVVEVRRVRRKIAGEARLAIDSVLARLARTGVSGADPALLSEIDRAMGHLLAQGGDRPRRRALLGLVGLRRGLFRDAPGFEPPTPIVGREIAA